MINLKINLYHITVKFAFEKKFFLQRTNNFNTCTNVIYSIEEEKIKKERRENKEASKKSVTIDPLMKYLKSMK